MTELHTVNLPDIGEGVVEGEVIEWLKQVGDPLKQDEPVVVIMTDKATVELPAPYPGRLANQYVATGKVAIKGKPLYDIDLTEKVAIPDKGKETPVQSNLKEPCKQKTVLQDTSEVLATPYVRGRAKELGVDLKEVEGTGKEGRIELHDLVKTPFKSIPSVLHLADDEEVPLTGIRQLMAKKMSEARDNIPLFSYFEAFDATRLIKLKDNYKQEAMKQGIHVTFMPFIIKALSLAMEKFPSVNSSLDTVTNQLVIHKHHNIGIAMSSHYGLIVPVLKNVQAMSLNDVILAYEDLKKRAFESKLQAAEMKESTITITNFGGLSGEGQWATPIVNYPEVAILGVARIHKEPVVKNNEVVIRDMMHLSWSFDHRVVDGDMAASFSQVVVRLLENPAKLLEK